MPAILLPQSGLATVLDVPGDYATIQAAIDAAAAGDTVRVAGGVYTGCSQLTPDGHFALMVLKSGVTVTGVAGDSTSVVLDGENYGRLAYAEGVTGATLGQGPLFFRGPAKRASRLRAGTSAVRRWCRTGCTDAVGEADASSARWVHVTHGIVVRQVGQMQFPKAADKNHDGTCQESQMEGYPVLPTAQRTVADGLGACPRDRRARGRLWLRVVWPLFGPGSRARSAPALTAQGAHMAQARCAGGRAPG